MIKIISLMFGLLGVILGGIEFYKYRKEVNNWKKSSSYDIWSFALIWGWGSAMLITASGFCILMFIFIVMFS